MFKIFGYAKNHGKKFPEYSQTLFSGIVNFGAHYWRSKYVSISFETCTIYLELKLFALCRDKLMTIGCSLLILVMCILFRGISSLCGFVKCISGKLNL